MTFAEEREYIGNLSQLFDVKEYRLTGGRQDGAREYVAGLEPANAPIEGRAQVRKDGELPFIAPGEKRDYHLEIEAGKCR